ncbi:MAG TPA: hypothetical protein VK669_11680, partial [Candidatus Limnocylindrales bacterium]|nr:hypothetical protein [Candidatus Limnocylindrales bacterium]
MPRVKIDGWECSRCGHVWVSREDAKPRVCPRCKSPLWDVPRVPKPPAAPKPKPWKRDRPPE